MAVQSMVHQANEVRENKVTTIKTDTGEIKLSSKIVKAYLVAGGGNVSDQEVKLFIALCSAQKLNPFIKEAHLIKYGSSPATMVVSKDVYQKRADKHPEYQGKKAGIIVLTAEGKIDYRVGTFYIPSREELVGGWCEVYRKDREPERVEVSLDEYVGKKKDGTVNAQWSGKPATMIRKVAVAQCLREAFTSEFQGMYVPEEMGVEDTTSNFVVEETPQVHQAIEATTAPTMQDIINEEKQAEPVPVDDFAPMSM